MARWTSRFRRSHGLGGGFRLNFTKRGIGLSAGSRGLRRSWHSTGRRTSSVGLPGTGVSWQKTDRLRSNESRGRPDEHGQQGAQTGEGDGQGLLDLARRAQREIEGQE